MERIPSRHISSSSTTSLLNSTFGEHLEQLRGVGPKEQTTRSRGKKLKIAPGKSYCEENSDEKEESEEENTEEGSEEEEVDADELLGGGDQQESQRRQRVVRESVDTDEEEDFDDDLLLPFKMPPLYAVGTYVAAVYDSEWYVAQVEGEEPENECDGFTLLKYMERKGNNQFVWGAAKDKLKTINSDIIRVVDPPIPVSSRLWGLPKDVVKDIEKRMRVKWSIIFISCPVMAIMSWLSLNCCSVIGTVLCPVIAVLS
jgi:hypothetical protein